MLYSGSGDPTISAIPAVHSSPTACSIIVSGSGSDMVGTVGPDDLYCSESGVIYHQGSLSTTLCRDQGYRERVTSIIAYRFKDFTAKLQVKKSQAPLVYH